MKRQDIHLLLDLSSGGITAETIRNSIESLASVDMLGGLVVSATVLVPALQLTSEEIRVPGGWSITATSNPAQDANSAIELAADANRFLLVVLGPVPVSGETVSMLFEAFAEDPHFGVSVPRQCDSRTGQLLKLSSELGDPELESFPRRVLTELPDYYIIPEILTSCFLVRDTVVSTLPFLDQSFKTLNGALLLYLLRIRRAGFRTAVLNRAILASASENDSRKLLVSKSDVHKLHYMYPDAGKAKAELADHLLHQHESLLGRLFSPRRQISRSLLLDIRGVPSHMNGTAEAILGLCDGLQKLGHDWTLSLLAEETAADYHSLRDRYPGSRLLTPHESGHHFTVAFRTSQPWHIKTLIELHGMALLNFYAMLDTIAWDILFEAPRALAASWDFMCQQADGLLYNSCETRNHVMRRFPFAQNTPAHVFHHSFDPRDYVVQTPQPFEQDAGYVFVIGNSYDHKHLHPTVDLLSSAFPFQSFKVLGMTDHPNPMVQGLESGPIAAAEIESLFARAKLIVFPSLYEGFGLPVLKGLSYGRTVVARESELLREVVSYYRGPGTVLAFSTPAELVDLLGRYLHGQKVETVALGTALRSDQPVINWSGVARGVLDFMEAQLADTNSHRWLQRESVIRQIDAAGS